MTSAWHEGHIMAGYTNQACQACRREERRGPRPQISVDADLLAVAIARRIGWESTSIALGGDIYRREPNEWDRQVAEALAGEYARLVAERAA